MGGPSEGHGVARAAAGCDPPPAEAMVSYAWAAVPRQRRELRLGSRGCVRDGTSAVLKLSMPHMEGEHEIHGLRFWSGAMLIERCQPGTPLRDLPEPRQDVVIARLLRRLWRSPSAPHPFRRFSALMGHRSNETLAAAARWPDPAYVARGRFVPLGCVVARGSFCPPSQLDAVKRAGCALCVKLSWRIARSQFPATPHTESDDVTRQLSHARACRRATRIAPADCAIASPHPVYGQNSGHPFSTARLHPTPISANYGEVTPTDRSRCLDSRAAAERS